MRPNSSFSETQIIFQTWGANFPKNWWSETEQKGIETQPIKYFFNESHNSCKTRANHEQQINQKEKKRFFCSEEILIFLKIEIKWDYQYKMEFFIMQKLQKKVNLFPFLREIVETFLYFNWKGLFLLGRTRRVST